LEKAEAPRVMLVASHLPTEAQGKQSPMEHPTFYRTTRIEGLSIFYREAGPKDAATLLLLHGLPSSSRMFEPLGDRAGPRADMGVHHIRRSPCHSP